MRALMGFAMGYVLGAKAGPKGFEELKDAFFTILKSEEFKGLVLAGTTLARDVAERGRGKLVEQMQGMGARNGELVQAWRRVSSSREFETLMKHGAGMLDEMLEQANARRDDGRREETPRPLRRRRTGSVRWRRFILLNRASQRMRSFFPSVH